MLDNVKYEADIKSLVEGWIWEDTQSRYLVRCVNSSDYRILDASNSDKLEVFAVDSIDKVLKYLAEQGL